MNVECYPLKKFLGTEPICLIGGWYLMPNERGLDVEKLGGIKTSSRYGWIENYDGDAYICGDLPKYVRDAYRKFIDKHTQLVFKGDMSRK